MINPENVYKVYSGKVNKCACGCCGNYRYASKHYEYAIQLNESVWKDYISDRAVKLIINRMNKLTPKEEDGYYFVETPTRLYIAYKVH